MNIKQLQPVILMVSISFLATPLTSCGRNAQTTTDSPSAEAVTGASEAPDDPSAAARAMLEAFGAATSGVSKLQGTEKWKKIAPNEIKDNPVLLCDNSLALASGKEGDMNAMTVAWMTLGRIWSDPVAMVYISPDRYTSEFLERNEYFTITAFPDEDREKLMILGTQSGWRATKYRMPDSPLNTRNLAIRSIVF
ncbi:MAG: hypothetical protein LBD79_01925 [Treponema sp.]|jgi:hypothetical protein|nr:hypothetical protein [Treponema sp.]